MEYEYMMQRNELNKWEMLESFFSESESLKIKVFTSSSCTFCSEALEAAREAAKKFHEFNLPIEVIETSVEEQPEIVEALNVIALPMILIGNSQIIGLPNTEDIELLLHQTVLAG
ncbi:MAG: thioredoxin family protein [Candidatus Thorarchaeota archaeon]